MVVCTFRSCKTLPFNIHTVHRTVWRQKAITLQGVAGNLHKTSHYRAQKQGMPSRKRAQPSMQSHVRHSLYKAEHCYNNAVLLKCCPEKMRKLVQWRFGHLYFFFFLGCRKQQLRKRNCNKPGWCCPRSDWHKFCDQSVKSTPTDIWSANDCTPKWLTNTRRDKQRMIQQNVSYLSSSILKRACIYTWCLGLNVLYDVCLFYDI